MEDFVEFIGLFFEGERLFSTIGFDGEEISEAFYNEYHSFYSAQDYESLKVAADSEIAYLIENYNQAEPMISSYSSTTQQHYVTNYRMVITSPPLPFVGDEFGTMMNAYFYEDTTTNKITSVGVPLFQQYSSSGGLFPNEINNVVVYSPVINSAKTRVTFSASYSVYKVVQGHREYAGSFTHSDTYNNAGTLMNP